MNYTKGDLLYEGKAKRIYQVVENEDLVWMEFKDSLTAFNAEKKGEFSGKGEINTAIAKLVFDCLQKGNIPSHLEALPSSTEMVCRKVEIIPLEVVIRNRLAGSTAKRFHFKEGTALDKPLVEFYYKNDDMGDPFISDDQALMLKAVSERHVLDQLRQRALQINEVLVKAFELAGIELIDYKLEFGFDKEGQLLLADEITPDSCRLWDIDTGKKLDKDRFRHDLGEVEESYNEVLNRLKKAWEN